jgi:lipopolysaccharide assembly protein A
MMMRTFRLFVLFAVMALWVWIGFLNFGHSAEWTLPGINGYLSWPVGLLMIVSFLLGALPMWLVHKVSRWSWSRKLTKTEQKLADSALPNAPVPPRDAEADLLARARAAGGVTPLK